MQHPALWQRRPKRTQPRPTRRLSASLLLATLCCIPIGDVQAQPCTYERADLPAGAWAWAAAVIPSSGDAPGRVAVSDIINHRIHVFALADKGRFALEETHDIGLQARAMAAGDLDRNGAVDLIFGGGGGEGELHVLWGGEEGFERGDPYDGPTALYDVETADLDGDGALEVICPSSTGAPLTILRFDGRTLADTATPLRDELPNLASAAVSDFSGDGKPDLIVGAATGSRSLLGLRQGADGTFEIVGSIETPGNTHNVEVIPSPGGEGTFLATHSIGKDAPNEIAIVNVDGGFNLAHRDVYPFAAGPTHTAVLQQANGGSPMLAIALIGKPGDQYASVFAVATGEKTHLAPRCEVPIPGAPIRVVAGDINGDGADDAVVCILISDHPSVVLLSKPE